MSNDVKMEIILQAKNMADAAFKSFEDRMASTVKASNLLKGALAGLAAGVTIAGINRAFTTVIDKSNEQIKAETKLAATLKSTGNAAGFTSQQLIDYAGALQTVTTFGDETIIGAQALLATFTNLSGDVFKRTTKAALDLSALLDQDLNSSVMQLGKALNDPIANLGALSRAGIQFSNDQKATIKAMVETNRLADAQGVILKELEKQFGGTATALRGTYKGALQGAANAFGDLQEKIGNAFTQNQSLIDSVNALGTSLSKLAVDPAFLANIESLANKVATVVKYAGLRSVDDTFGQAVELSQKGLLSLTEFARLGFLERQRLVDDILEKQARINTSAHEEWRLKGAAFGAGPARFAPASLPPALNPYAPSEKDWALFHNDSLIEQRDWLGDMAGEVTQHHQVMAETWRIFHEDKLMEQKSWGERALEAIADDLERERQEIEKFNDYANRAFAGWASGFASDLNEAMWGAEFSFDKIAKSFGKMLTQMWIQKQLMEPLLKFDFGKTFTDFGKWIGGLGGSAGTSTGYIPGAMGMADGGTIKEPIFGIGKSGQAYAFGEGGIWEDVVPRGKGKSAGGGTITTIFQIQAIDTRSGAEFIKQNGAAMAQTFTDELKHNPMFARFVRGH